MAYPIEANAALVNEATIAAYGGAMYGLVDFEVDDYVVLRGIPERGTSHEGIKPTSYPVQAKLVPLVPAIVYAAQRWAQYKYATYLIPAVTKDPSGKAESIRLMTAVMVDLDKGDTTAALAHAVMHVGPPSFAVLSGGVTAEGHAKMHLYWLLREPSADIAKCMRVRDLLARKLGGDRALGIADHGAAIGRAHQPIRIPGTVYAKGETDDTVSTRAARLVGPINTSGYELDELLERVEEMGAVPGVELVVARPNGGLVIPMGELRTEWTEAVGREIHEGGDGDRNRWTEFSRVVGGFLVLVRKGEITVHTAYMMACSWVQTQMKPPWPQERIDREFAALLAVDRRNHPEALYRGGSPQWDSVIAMIDKAASEFYGQRMPGAPDPLAQARARYAPGGPVSAEATVLPFPVEGAPAPLALPGFAASDIAYKPVPEMRWVVEGMIPTREASGLVADGAVGKSYLLLDLGLSLAGGRGLEPPDWLGHKVNPVDGLVIILSAEDNQEELERRLHALATPEEIAATGGRLWLLPMPDLGGAQPIAANRRKRVGDELIDLSGSTPFWESLLAAIKAKGVPCSFFGLDTFSSMSHDDENKAKTIREFMHEAMRVPRELGATLQITHHLRKHESGEGFRNADEALMAMRGSTGLPNALRAVTVIYKPKDWTQRMRALGKAPRPKQLYCCGTPKLNRPGGESPEVVLLRDERGLLVAVDVPDSNRRELAAMALSVRRCVLAGAPLSVAGRESAPDACRMRLHPAIRDLPRWRLRKLLTDCEREHRIVACRIAGVRATRGASYFDVLGGPLAGGSFTRDDMHGGAIKVDYARYQWSEAREEWLEEQFQLGGEQPQPETAP